MVIVKCKECSQEYELKEGDDPSSYQCDCGGKLDFKGSINYHHETENASRDKIAYGYSHTDEKSFKYKFIMVIGIAIIFIGLLGIVTFNLIGLILAVLGFFIFYVGYNKGYSWIKGDKGEKIVSKYLEDLPSGYFTFNDVTIPGGKGNFDHIVIGPSGIFLIETKNYSGFFKIYGNDWYSRSSSQKMKRNPGNQVRLNALD